MKFGEIYANAPENLKDLSVDSIQCDSRRVTKNSVFVCINGSALDGHKYAQSAYDNGASVIVCQRDLNLPNQLIVDDSREVYSTLCANFFGNPAKKLKLIGITGTSGKTTTTYMVRSMLEKSGHKTGLIGTIMNIVGENTLPAKNTTPDAYELHSLFDLMLKAGCEYVVMEVSSHALDQKRVWDLEFECAVFTNLTQDHLDYHITMQNYFEAKLRLFKMCKIAVINLDDEYSKAFIDACDCKVLTYSAKDKNADFFADNIEYKADGVSYDFINNENKQRVDVKIPGSFTVYNSMTAGAGMIACGMDFNTAAKFISEVEGVKGRVEVVPSDKDFTMIIDYAHTPDELENVIKMLNNIKTGRVVTLFGCGGDRDKTKRPIMGEIAAKFSDYVIVTSDNPRSENPTAIIEDILVGMKGTKTPYIVIENRAEAIKYAVKNAKSNDIVLFAGKGHETYQILQSGTIHFDEREIIAQALK